MSFLLFSDRHLKTRSLFGGVDRRSAVTLLTLSRHTAGAFQYDARIVVAGVQCVISIKQPTISRGGFQGTIRLSDETLSWVFDYSFDAGGPVLAINDATVGKTVKTTGYRHHWFEIKIATGRSICLHDPFADVNPARIPMELVRARFGFGKTKIGDVNDDLNEDLHPDQERILALLAATLTLECGLQSWDNV